MRYTKVLDTLIKVNKKPALRVRCTSLRVHCTSRLSQRKRLLDFNEGPSPNSKGMQSFKIVLNIKAV